MTTKPRAIAHKAPRKLGRPPKSEGVDRRAMILEAALDLFSTIGYEATTVREIAQKVGVRDAALYGHFESKAAIRDALFETHGPRAVYNILEKLDLTPLASDPRQFAKTALRNLAARWLESSEKKFFRVLLMENLRADTEPSISIARIQAPMRKKLLTLATWLVDNGIAIKTDPRWLVEQFVAPLSTIRTEVALSRDEITLTSLVNRMDEHLDNFIAAFLPNFPETIRRETR